MPLTYDEYRVRRYFPALDGIRAVAILLVFTAHVIYRPVWRVFNGSEGVTLFFVLSGFLISTLALREEDRRQRLSLRSFYIRRVFRIYPMYFATIAVYCLLIYGAGFVADRREAWTGQLPYYVFGFPEYHNFTVFAREGLESGPPLQGLWSIGIEEKFYLVWPLLGFVVLHQLFHGRRRRSSRLAAALVLLVVCAFAPAFWRNGEYLFQYVYILLGVILAVLLHHQDTYDRLRPLGRPAVALATATAAVVMLVVVLPLDPHAHALHFLFGIAVTIAIAGVVTARRDIFGLATPPMVLIGAISYVFYLTHAFALNIVEKTPLGQPDLAHSLADVAVALPLALGGAWVIHRLFEQPLIRVGHRLARRDSVATTELTRIDVTASGRLGAPASTTGR
jgi:peptidoglycan/LPS O-acetylase OafA/YrhL